MAVDVFLDELGELGLLVFVQLAIGNAGILKSCYFREGRSQYVARSLVSNYGLIGLFCTERVAQLAGGKFLYLEGNQFAAGAKVTYGRVASPEAGYPNDLAIENGVVERQVMTFKTPTPRPLVARFAEDENMVGLRVSHETAIFAFKHEKDVLEKHDIFHLRMA